MSINQGQTEQLKGKISAAEFIYLAYFTVMFGARAIGLFEGMPVYNISLVIGMLLFAAKVLVTEHTVLEYLVMGGLLFTSVLVYYNTGEKGLLLYFTMMLGMKGVSLRRVFKLGTVILGTAFSVLVLLSVTGLKEDIIYVKERAGFGNVIRHSLGYPYPNTLFTTYIILMVLIMYMLGKQRVKNLLLTSLMMLIGSLYIFIYSCSNTGLIVAVFYLLVNLYLQLRPRLSRFEKIGIMLIYPLCLLVSIVGPLVTSGKIFQLFDKVLHNRWAYSLYYLTNEPVTLFGVRFREAPNDNYMIDSSFLYSFLQIGVVPFVILTLLNLGMIYDCVKKKRKIELAIILSFCLLGMSDPFLFNLSYKNLLFLFVGELLYRKLQQAEDKNLGLLKRKIQLLSIGNKVLTCDKGAYRWCSQRLSCLSAFLSANSGKASVIYLVSAVVIVSVLYLTGWSDFIVAKVDQVEEWEYVRGVLSIGLWGSILIAGTVMLVTTKRKKQNATRK